MWLGIGSDCAEGYEADITHCFEDEVIGQQRVICGNCKKSIPWITAEFDWVTESNFVDLPESMA
jgi:hypothetical protein